MGNINHIFGELRLEPDYLSNMNHLRPAMSKTAIAVTTAALKKEFGPQLSRPVSNKRVIQCAIKKSASVDKESSAFHFYNSSDREWLGFILDLQERIERTFPVEVSKDGSYVTGDGINRVCTTLLTNADVPMNPSLSPKLDTIGGDLSIPLPDLYKKVLSTVSRLYFEKWTPTSFGLNSVSKTGLPVNVHDKLEKLYLLRDQILPRADDMIKALAAGDYDYFVSEFGCVPVAMLTYRDQIDKFGKERWGHDVTGKYVLANKVVTQAECNGFGKFHNFQALRRRNAYAIPFLLNVLGQVLTAGCRVNALEEYGDTWHDHGDDDIKKILNSMKHFALYDADAFDTTFRWDEICIMIDSIPIISDVFKEYIKKVHRLPIVVKSDSKDVAGAFLVNCDTYQPGLQSGTFDVSDLGKIRGASGWLYGLFATKLVKLNEFDLDNDLEKQIVSIMKHENKFFKMMNRGDDTVPLYESAADGKIWCEFMENLPFMKWSRDNGAKFTGRIIYRKDANAPVELYRDLITLLEKSFLNEHSMFSRHRSFAATGMLLRLDYCKEHPSYGRFMQVVEQCFYDHFKVEWLDAIEKSKSLEPSISDFDYNLSKYNQATREFIMDRATIHYKIKSINEIHPDILNSELFSVDTELVKDLAKKIGIKQETATWQV